MVTANESIRLQQTGNGVPGTTSQSENKMPGPRDVESVTDLGRQACMYYEQGKVNTALKLANVIFMSTTSSRGCTSPRAKPSPRRSDPAHLSSGSAECAAKECPVTMAAIASFDGLATHCIEDGNQAAALHIRKGLMDLCSSTMGEEHSRTITTVAYLANKYHSFADWPNAAKFGLKAVTAARKVLGWDMRVMCLAACVLAEARMHLGQHAEAEQACREAIQKMRETPLNNVDLLVRAMACLSDMLQDAAKETAELFHCVEVYLRENMDKEGAEDVVMSRKAIMGGQYYRLGYRAFAAEALFRLNKPRQQTRNALLPRQLNEAQQHQEDLLSKLYGEPTSPRLQEWLDDSSEHAPLTDETFFDGCKVLADICGLRRHEYYDNSLKGLHHMTAFASLLDNPPIFDRPFGLYCPPTWTYILKPNFMLVYAGDGPSSQAISDALRGPTLADCNMGRTIVLLALLRRFMGLKVFDAAFPLKYLTVAQSPPTALDHLLWAFFDPLHSQKPSTIPRVQLRTTFNHPRYLARHPLGSARLEHTICYGGQHIALTSSGLRVLSEEELQRSLMAAFNTPRSGTEQDWLAQNLNLSDSTMVAVFEDLKDLDEPAWSLCATTRAQTGSGLQLVLNTDRLNFCIEKVKKAQREGILPNDIVSIGRRAKEEYLRAKLGVCRIAEATTLVTE
ncbi:hypothetical protein PWT90_03518 [Aphanocladium album]|nr:hypothetical protein PWT90_03518 [Aphanocladium album]